nr:uncharacterized protein CI109_002190 [Kwoniella shandongensis]KAA5529297.1 hypothetical protein CI109_002190 [Kwoniella shandongensis]
MFNLNLVTVLFVLGISTTKYVSAQAVFAGCVDVGHTFAGASMAPGTTDQIDCANACFNGKNSQYSYYLPPQPENNEEGGDPSGGGIPGGRKRSRTGLTRRDTEPLCYCTFEPPTAATLVAPQNSPAGSECDTNQFQAFVTRSSYSFEGCYSGFSSDETTYVPQGVTDDVEGCLQLCISYTYSIYTPSKYSSYCLCGNDNFAPSTGAVCAAETYFIYSHTPNTAYNSQFAKRQLRERLVRDEAATRRAICPGGMKACNVAGVTDAFECINTHSELESCGGCLYGDFNSIDASNGVDCAALPGVARGGVTCTSGACQAFACKTGYSLASNATCVAI